MKDIGTIERPTFFGPPEKSVFGVVHMPEDGRVRGTALICPPLAKEHFDTVRGLRLLADRIASAGFAVLRFDYYGTGDSALSSERDDIVSQWLESIQHAAAYLRDLSAGDLAIVGLRAGALLACAALPTIGSVGSVALWDPVGRGKTYLREQSALYTMTVGGSAGAFAFRLLDLAAATAVTVDSSGKADVSGQLSPRSETDAYSFTAKAGERYYFQRLQGNYNSAFWRLIGPSGQVVMGPSDQWYDVENVTLPAQRVLPQASSGGSVDLF